MIDVNDSFGADAPVYVISVAAELAGMHPQTLRQYDRLGIVSPGRASGRGRRYSMRDVQTLREVQRLSQEEGINLAGIKRILELGHEVEQLREQVFHLANELEAARRAVARRGRPTGSGGGAVRGELVRRTRVTIFNTAEPPEDDTRRAGQDRPAGEGPEAGDGTENQG
ncbi:heat shock protein transcriptional repressor HspR [Nocardiopsis aegyptia]|uniref:MerR family transcriptional regulator/heat shock protein HspR n=1 Tax=Nocardiopsis aegyptia TaxID=220378 RepID=A0A7Z0JBP1_9ACTN|nr:helix-turn-helix transcriptional regulator [Nocardiopsis aegyptia]NYJ35629.1 MerR family transcriptional regulator/heat shock protein HspR [Nocardiopsis aegyptia]